MKIVERPALDEFGSAGGLGEIELPALQPGSSIMPGKVNPVIPEAMAMVCAQVIGNDATITIAGQSGNFQLNVMLPVIALNLLAVDRDSCERGARSSPTRRSRASRCARTGSRQALDRNPILVTALNPVIGYEKGAATAKQAYKEGRAILDVALETTGSLAQGAHGAARSRALTKGGIHGGSAGGWPRTKRFVNLNVKSCRDTRRRPASGVAYGTCRAPACDDNRPSRVLGNTI